MSPLPSRGFTRNIKSYFLWKTMKKYLEMSSAAVVISALRVKRPKLPLYTSIPGCKMTSLKLHFQVENSANPILEKVIDLTNASITRAVLGQWCKLYLVVVKLWIFLIQTVNFSAVYVWVVLYRIVHCIIYLAFALFSCLYRTRLIMFYNPGSATCIFSVSCSLLHV